MNVIYARQSIDKKDSLSIEAQIEQCRKFAGTDARVFRDKGYSGKNIKRPAFTELIKEIESGRVSKIFVYRLDRFSRSIADFSRLWEKLDKYGVEFLSATENFDTSTPIGRAMLNIVLVFAQLERETTAERVKDNYLHRFRLGAWGGGPAPFGFDLTKITVDGVKTSSLSANEKAEVVKWMFNEYLKEGSSLRSVAKSLTERGMHGPKRDVWDSVTVSRILHSPVYVKADSGVYWFYLAQRTQTKQEIEMFDGVHGASILGRRDRSGNKYNSLHTQMLTVSNHKGIIEPDIFIKVQEKLSQNTQISKINAGKYSYLTGLMKCAKCGYAIKINYSKKENKRYLICSGHSNLATCDCKINVNLVELENYVEQEMIELLKKSPEKLEIPKGKKNIEEVLSLEKKIERLVSALSESSEISATYISKQIDVLHKKRQELLNGQKKEKVNLERIDFKRLELDEKKIIASEFIEKIELSDENANIIWKI